MYDFFIVVSILTVIIILILIKAGIGQSVILIAKLVLEVKEVNERIRRIEISLDDLNTEEIKDTLDEIRSAIDSVDSSVSMLDSSIGSVEYAIDRLVDLADNDVDDK